MRDGYYNSLFCFEIPICLSQLPFQAKLSLFQFVLIGIQLVFVGFSFPISRFPSTIYLFFVAGGLNPGDRERPSQHSYQSSRQHQRLRSRQIPSKSTGVERAPLLPNDMMRPPFGNPHAIQSEGEKGPPRRLPARTTGRGITRHPEPADASSARGRRAASRPP